MTPSNIISVIVAIRFVVFIGLGDSSQVYCDDLRFSSIDNHYHLPTSRKKSYRSHLARHQGQIVWDTNSKAQFLNIFGDMIARRVKEKCIMKEFGF